MTLLGLAALVFCLLSVQMAFVVPDRKKLIVVLLLFAAHLGATMVYYTYALEYSSDSNGYFFDPLGYINRPFRLGTTFVVQLVQWSRAVLGGTFIDYFLVFQAVGFLGLIFLMRTFVEIYEEFDRSPSWIAYLLLFMPGLHFWTSSIGKDGPLFFAVCLSIWAAMRLKSRLVPFCVAIVIMLFFRPHIALIALIALSLSLVFDRRTKVWVRTLLVLAAMGGILGAISSIEATFEINVADADSVFQYLESRGNIYENEAGGNTVVQAPFAIRLLSLLYRPLFVDANGIFAIIASFESAAFILMTGTMLVRFRSVRRLLKTVFFLRYAFWLSVGVTLLLSMVYFNVGLGLRQRAMLAPGFIVLFVALLATRQARRSGATVPAAVPARVG